MIFDIGPVVSEEMFENVDRLTDNGRQKRKLEQMVYYELIHEPSA